MEDTFKNIIEEYKTKVNNFEELKEKATQLDYEFNTIYNDSSYDIHNFNNYYNDLIKIIGNHKITFNLAATYNDKKRIQYDEMESKITQKYEEKKKIIEEAKQAAEAKKRQEEEKISQKEEKRETAEELREKLGWSQPHKGGSRKKSKRKKSKRKKTRRKKSKRKKTRRKYKRRK